MTLRLTGRLVGGFLMLFGATYLAPAIVSLIYADGTFWPFVVTAFIHLLAGFSLWARTPDSSGRISYRDGFAIVALLWIATSFLCSIPFLWGLHLSFSHAVFETVSAVTTTGVTVITGLDSLPPSLLFYRQELQWLGGIGVILFAVALLPMLGVGGMQLLRAEFTGPIKDDKLLPRITQFARTVLIIYLALTIACALAYRIAGMSWFDAICHSFSTLSTGGFSTHDASFAFFDSAALELICVIFMLLGAINFGVHYLVWHRRDLNYYWDNIEVRVFLLIVIAIVLIVAVTLYNATDIRLADAMQESLFNVVSVITTTGYTTDDFSQWPLMLPALMVFVFFVGGCAGSTSGGIKVIRFLVLGRQGILEIQRLIHPNLVRPLKLHGRIIDDRISDAVWAFFSVYVATFVVLMIIVIANGMDQITAFSAIATCLNNVGPGQGDVATTFSTVSDGNLWVCSVAMILGRLEIFTILVLLTPAYWRR